MARYNIYHVTKKIQIVAWWFSLNPGASPALPTIKIGQWKGGRGRGGQTRPTVLAAESAKEKVGRYIGKEGKRREGRGRGKEGRRANEIVRGE